MQHVDPGELTMRNLPPRFLALLALLIFLLPSSAGAAIYSNSQIANFFRNSGNDYLAANAQTFANMSSNVENTAGDTTLYNKTCCTGLMQMNRSNILAFCGCSREQYAALDGQAQINIYTKYFASIANDSSIKKLMDMQANGQTLGGYPVTGGTIVACIQLGTGNCRKAIANNCAGVSPAQGGDGHVSICTMGAKAGGGAAEPVKKPGGTGGAKGTCMVNNPFKGGGEYVGSPYAVDRTGNAAASAGYHLGLDIYAGSGATMGTLLLVPNQAKISNRYEAKGCGHYITFTRPDGTLIQYCHTQAGSRGYFEDGTTVEAGKEVGKVGCSGMASCGPHLHLQVQVPKSMIPGLGVAKGFGTTKGGSLLTAAQIASGAGGGRDYYKVNPEFFLASQIPWKVHTRYANDPWEAEHKSGQTVPNTCGVDSAQPLPGSSAETPSPQQAASGAAAAPSTDSAINELIADNDPKGIYTELLRSAFSDLDAATVGSRADDTAPAAWIMGALPTAESAESPRSPE